MLKRLLSKQNRALVSELVRTDFKLRYQGSVLGYIWSLLRPLLLFLILYVVFVKFLKVGNGIPNYPVYLLLGMILWNFFVEMTMQSLGSIVGRGDLIRKIKIPRWIIVISSSISAVINLLLNLVVLTIFMIFNHVHPTGLLTILPLIFFELYLFSLGVSFFLATAFVRFRDINYVWEIILQAGFYITPILYPLSRINNVFFQKLIILNPMSQIIQDARYVTVTKETTTNFALFNGELYFLIPFILVILILFFSANYFRRKSKYFAEEI